MYDVYCKLRDSKGVKDATVAKATGINQSTSGSDDDDEEMP